MENFAKITDTKSVAIEAVFEKAMKVSDTKLIALEMSKTVVFILQEKVVKKVTTTPSLLLKTWSEFSLMMGNIPNGMCRSHTRNS